MQKLLVLCCIGLFSFTTKFNTNDGPGTDDKKFPSLISKNETAMVNHLIDSLYDKLQLAQAGLEKNVFFNAYKGFQYLQSKGKLNNQEILTICDYSQSSHNKRLYVIDLKDLKLLYNTYVSHGKNSGSEFATDFSNKTNSNKSSLGFLITKGTYMGRNGYSLRFDGVEKGFNDKVNSRNIVMHGSKYVNEKRADEGNMMGRSFGCPAVSYEVSRAIIDDIKGGSCFFIYSNDMRYVQTSTILNSRFEWPVLTPVKQPSILAQTRDTK